jgi:hypothetical protein
MSPQRYSDRSGVVLEVLQLGRLGWPIAVTTPWGTLMIPLWPNWIAAAFLAWLGFRASRA